MWKKLSNKLLGQEGSLGAAVPPCPFLGTCLSRGHGLNSVTENKWSFGNHHHHHHHFMVRRLAKISNIISVYQAFAVYTRAVLCSVCLTVIYIGLVHKWLRVTPNNITFNKRIIGEIDKNAYSLRASTELCSTKWSKHSINMQHWN